MASDSDVQPVGDPERDFVLLLLSLYREKPLLWDVKNNDYTNKYRRHVALCNICNALKEYKPNYTVQELKRKFNILRTNFNKERNKIEKRKSLCSESEPQTTLWYYNDMAFLIGQEMPAKRDYVVDNSKHHPKLLRNIKRKKISVFSDSSNLKRPENEEDILAKWWAIKLRKLDPNQRLFAEKIINDTLFEAKMGTLTRYGVTFNPEPTNWVEYSSESDSEPAKETITQA